MKTKITTIIVFILTTTFSFSQQINDGYAPIIPDFTIPLKSGVYNGATPIGITPDNSNPWQHLFVIRHTDQSNNFQLQIGSSFADNDRLFFRKIVSGDLSSQNPNWKELATRASNNFIGNQSISANLGIGIINPQAGLDIFKSYDTNNTKAIKIMYQGSWGTPQYASNYRLIDIQSTEEGTILALNAYGMGLGFNPPSYNSPDKLYVNGNVGIGTMSTGDHKLAVEGSIGAREIKVQATGWSDFVFKKEYILPSLEEVEKHINKKGHLKNIPSEEEVLKNGINLGEMNAKLLQKIEELTLYMIDQNKQLKAQNDQIKLQNQEIQLLKKAKI